MPGTSSARPPRRRGAAFAFGAAALLVPLLGATPGAGAASGDGGLTAAYSRAADRYDVPREVLLAVSYLSSRWDGHGGHASVAGGYGPMHLTDVTTATAEASGEGHHHGAEDARGDAARPRTVAAAPAARPAPAAPAARPAPAETGRVPARLRTVERAATLTGLPAKELRTGTDANLAGGAALLADAQRAAKQPLSDDPADWYAAVAAYSGAEDAATRRTYADDVYDVLRTGASRVTDSGERVRLAADPKAAPDAAQAAALAAKGRPAKGVECPRSVSCEWRPAPYEEYENEDGTDNYGNHDLADRPESQQVDYIVVHDTEATWDTTLDLVSDPTYVSWHYSMRASDGHVAQHVRTKDIAWHAGNWYVNAKSVGVEHEGFLVDPDAWYTEAMYRSSARLVRYLAHRYDIPIDRQHILGHDNVPGTTASTVAGMHTDPGPYFDWAHYFGLLGEPLHPTAGPRAQAVTIAPDYDDNSPVFTACEEGVATCVPHGSSAVRLHTAPDADAPLVEDAGLHTDGSGSTDGVNDTGARATAGQQYALAGRHGDWTAVWYLGQKAWFHDPRGERTALPARAHLVTPEKGKASVPVYGRAYPEASAYPAGVPVQELSPLPYEFAAGQSYVAGLRTKGEYSYSATFDPAGHTVVRGEEAYYQIQFGHRVAFVKASDVDVRRVR